MWDMRRRIVPSLFPKGSGTVKVTYPELSSGWRHWWVIIKDGTVDICLIDPGHEIDLFVRSSLRSMTSVWMGVSTLKSEIGAGNITLDGDRAAARSMERWLGLGSLAKEKRIAS
jgi:hypothetical protein